jgi:ElaB/YqjD/DUF883 family membrane-anchored ribosome-binding protein
MPDPEIENERPEAPKGRARPRPPEEAAERAELEDQVAQLQADLKEISKTLQELAESRVDGVRSMARSQVRDIADRGQQVIAEAQDEFEAIEKQVKDTIRERPLTAVATAAAAGFIFAVLTR